MQENFAKYNHSPRVGSYPLIDEAAIIFFGKTLGELMLPVGVFVSLALFVDAPGYGAMAGFVLLWLLPMYRTRCPRGFAAHIAWALGFHVPKNLPCGRIFTINNRFVRFGP